MFQSLVYKIQLELAVQLGSSEQHSSQRAFLGSISEGVLVQGWVCVRLSLLSFCLDMVNAKLGLIFHKCYWNHVGAAKDILQSTWESHVDFFESFVFSACNVIVLRKIATFFFFFPPFLFAFFFLFCGNKTKLLARQPALTALFLLLCEVWCHHLALGKPLSRWDSHKWPFCAPDLHVKKSDGNCSLWWLPLSFQLNMIW